MKRGFKMAEHIIENDYLKVTIEDKGAELVSVYDKENNEERIWRANPDVWNRHAPILFPFVGKVNNGVYRYNGKEYEMKTQHGFARDREFELVAETENSISHCLKADEESLKIYPFDFELTVTHRFSADNPRMVEVEWEVKNNGTDDMYYSIGGHPGFAIPRDNRCSREDYYLEFPEKAFAHYILINQSNGLAYPDESHPLVLNKSACHIARNMFDKDALIFENSQLHTVRILKPDRTPFISLYCAGFPYVGIWSKGEADFVCIEPWYGRTDNDGFTGDLKDKAGECKLSANNEKNISYGIEFHK